MTIRKSVAAMTATCCSLIAAAMAEEWPACRQVEHYPDSTWGEARPASLGWDGAALLDAKSRFEQLESAAVMVIHQGHLVATWGDPAEKFTAQSVRKGLLNSLLGRLVADGKLSLDQSLAELGIDDENPALTAQERSATVRDLMQSRSGIFHLALYEVGGWKELRLALAEEKASGAGRAFAPGDYWVYNNWDFNALGTIVENTAAMPIGPLFSREIAIPIAMQDFVPGDIEYTTRDHPAEQHFGNDSVHRAYIFNISTRDLARYGLMFMGCGKWQDTQVLPAAWVEESLDGIDTRAGRNADEQSTGFGDYGLLWQIDRPGARRYADLPTREPAYFATGNRGHFLGVFPYLDLIIVHQVGTRGGVSMEAQVKRATQGSPTVRQDELVSLLKLIIAAHPHGDDALLAE